jgi:hypothetical protein
MKAGKNNLKEEDKFEEGFNSEEEDFLDELDLD